LDQLYWPCIGIRLVMDLHVYKNVTDTDYVIFFFFFFFYLVHTYSCKKKSGLTGKIPQSYLVYKILCLKMLYINLIIFSVVDNIKV